MNQLKKCSSIIPRTNRMEPSIWVRGGLPGGIKSYQFLKSYNDRPSSSTKPQIGNNVASASTMPIKKNVSSSSSSNIRSKSNSSNSHSRKEGESSRKPKPKPIYVEDISDDEK